MLLAVVAAAGAVLLCLVAVAAALAVHLRREARQPRFEPYAPSEPARRWWEVRTRDRDPDTEEIPALTGEKEYE